MHFTKFCKSEKMKKKNNNNNKKKKLTFVNENYIYTSILYLTKVLVFKTTYLHTVDN